MQKAKTHDAEIYKKKKHKKALKMPGIKITKILKLWSEVFFKIFLNVLKILKICKFQCNCHIMN